MKRYTWEVTTLAWHSNMIYFGWLSSTTFRSNEVNTNKKNSDEKTLFFCSISLCIVVRSTWQQRRALKGRKLTNHIVRQEKMKRGERKLHEMNRMRRYPKKRSIGTQTTNERSHCNHDVVIHDRSRLGWYFMSRLLCVPNVWLLAQ